MLANETEGLFAWQFGDGACPGDCVREEDERGWCVESESETLEGGKMKVSRLGREL